MKSQYVPLNIIFADNSTIYCIILHTKNQYIQPIIGVLSMIFFIFAYIAEQNAGICSPNMILGDIFDAVITRNGRDLTGTLIADIVQQLLSYVAQTEREFIKQRQREGIEIAKANGVHLGRKAMDRPDNYEDIKSAWMNGELSGRSAAKMLGVSHTAFSNWVHNDQIVSTKNC